MKKLLLLTVCVAMATMMMAQTQKGYVKTKGRLSNDGQVIPGEPLGEVTIKVKDRNAVMSDKRGDFSFPMPDETYYLESVTKSGYVMIDPELLSKQYSYSKNKLVIALETRENQLEERMDMNEKIMKAQKELIDKLRAEVKQLRAENKITEDEYYKRLQEIVDMQNENRQLVEDLVDHYSKIDYDDMNEFDRMFSSYLLNGDLRKADSLVNSKGDLRQRADEYYQLREANAKAREDIDMRKKKLEKSEAAAIKMRDDLASDYYKKFEINKMQHKNDSAAYWLEERVKLDTTNVEWIIDAGDFLREYIADYDKAKIFYTKVLTNLDSLCDTDKGLYAIIYTKLGNIFDNVGDFEQSLAYYNQALSIRINILGEEHPDVAELYNNIGYVYDNKGDYDMALYYYNKAVSIWKDSYGINHIMIMTVYNNIGCVYIYKKDYDIALDYYEKALRIIDNITYEPNMELAYLYNNMGYIYFEKEDYDESLLYYSKSLHIKECIYGSEHPSEAITYHNIGSVYLHQYKYDEALIYCNKALTIRINTIGENNPNVASSYNSIGLIYNFIEDYDMALDNYHKALVLLIKAFGAEHPNIATTYYNIGFVYCEQENYEQALDYYNKAYSIRKSFWGEEDNRTQKIKREISEVEAKLAESNKK